MSDETKPDELKTAASEMDVYNVPAKSRYRIFQWGLTGMSLTASVLLIMLLRCATTSKDEVKELLKEQVQDLKEQARTESRAQVRQADASLSPQIDAVARENDSLKTVIKTLKN